MRVLFAKFQLDSSHFRIKAIFGQIALDYLWVETNEVLNLTGRILLKPLSPTGCYVCPYCCSDGECVPSEHICDIDSHCEDSGDEVRCQTVNVADPFYKEGFTDIDNFNTFN